MSFQDRLAEFRKCLEKLKSALEQPKTEFTRDSAIKRFELCFELCWKALKDFLRTEGIFCRSPKNCFKEAFSLGLLESEESWLKLIGDSNLSIHTYNEELAEELYKRLPYHLKTMENLLLKIENT